ncbi:hypothetical protein DT076_05285 [Desertihabitans brevis]|uniref:Uncharacterized protein n=1 Tax=Desertihabitans brevis TaxID=2268447 RepID=A0A367YY72_9ACTN|nr:hypothetical protein DT076_05285 [Desertihabitans brevis]
MWEASPQCGEATEPPVPEHALAATYLDEEGRPGNGLLLGFGSGEDAGRFAADYRAQLGSCPRADDPVLTVEAVEESEDWYAGRRSYGADRWSELVVQRGEQVLLLIVADDHASSPDDLRELAESLSS